MAIVDGAFEISAVKIGQAKADNGVSQDGAIRAVEHDGGRETCLHFARKVGAGGTAPLKINECGATIHMEFAYQCRGCGITRQGAEVFAPYPFAPVAVVTAIEHDQRHATGGGQFAVGSEITGFRERALRRGAKRRLGRLNARRSGSECDGTC
jgi:hypothetical protein